MNELVKRFNLWKRRLAVSEAYRRLYDTPEGQIVMHDLMRRCGILEVSAEAGDAHMTYFRDGRRSIALEIMQELRWTEGELVKLAQEQTSERLNMADAQQQDAA